MARKRQTLALLMMATASACIVSLIGSRAALSDQQSAPLPRATQRSDSHSPIPAKTSPPAGTLLVRIPLSVCSAIAYDVVAGSDRTGTGRAGGPFQVAVGSYDVVVKTVFGEEVRKVIVRSKETTIVEINLGALRVKGYPRTGGPSYSVNQPSAGGKYVSGKYVSEYDTDLCGPAGEYIVHWWDHFYTAYWGERTQTGVFPPSFKPTLPARVEPDRITVVDRATYPHQYGRLAFLPDWRPIRRFKIERLSAGETSEWTENFLHRAPGYLWMPAGLYRMTLINQPYIGTIYEFEIKPDEATSLRVPN